VARIDNLEFLSDVVPRTKTYREVKKIKAQAEADKAAAAANGVNGDRPASSSRNIQEMISGNEGLVNGSSHSPMADRTAPHRHPDPIRDLVEEPVSPSRNPEPDHSMTG
jgi:predicted PhzF superfamily epimerase YddE/YHI9